MLESGGDDPHRIGLQRNDRTRAGGSTITNRSTNGRGLPTSCHYVNRSVLYRGVNGENPNRVCAVMQAEPGVMEQFAADHRDHRCLDHVWRARSIRFSSRVDGRLPAKAWTGQQPVHDYVTSNASPTGARHMGGTGRRAQSAAS